MHSTNLLKGGPHRREEARPARRWDRRIAWGKPHLLCTGSCGFSAESNTGGPPALCTRYEKSASNKFSKRSNQCVRLGGQDHSRGSARYRQGSWDYQGRSERPRRFFSTLDRFITAGQYQCTCNKMARKSAIKRSARPQRNGRKTATKRTTPSSAKSPPATDRVSRRRARQG